ncbi:hypothetical protein BDC45DRAFT_508579 [Circinella umbellata]|nr:hypothetical protein BDC45DRAFT_508579 [Circinella umbellata]
MDSYGGNSGGGYVGSFIANSWVRSTWIAFFTLWVLWGLSYVFRHAFLRDDTIANSATDPAMGAADPEAAGKTNVLQRTMGKSGFNRRFRNFHSIMRDSVLMLLSVLVLNTFGVGSTRAALILSWIFVIFAILYAISDFVYENRYIRIIFSIILYACALAIGGNAMARGWTGFY